MTNQAIETGYHVTRVFLDGASQPVDDGDEVLTSPQVTLDGRRYVLVGKLPSEPAARASCVAALLAFDWDDDYDEGDGARTMLVPDHLEYVSVYFGGVQ